MSAHMQKYLLPVVAGLTGAFVAMILPTSGNTGTYADLIIGGLFAGFCAYRKRWIAGLVVGIAIVSSELIIFHSMQPDSADLNRLPIEVKRVPSGLNYSDLFRMTLEVALASLAGYVGGKSRDCLHQRKIKR